jgi:hypothetical protein
LRAEIPTAHLSKLVRAIRQANFWYLRYRPGRCDARGKVWLASDDPAVLDRALHADNTRVDRGNPAIAVLSIGYLSLGSCPRAAGWSAATLCLGQSRHFDRGPATSDLPLRADIVPPGRHVSNLPKIGLTEWRPFACRPALKMSFQSG